MTVVSLRDHKLGVSPPPTQPTQFYDLFLVVVKRIASAVKRIQWSFRPTGISRNNCGVKGRKNRAKTHLSVLLSGGSVGGGSVVVISQGLRVACRFYSPIFPPSPWMPDNSLGRPRLRTAWLVAM